MNEKRSIYTDKEIDVIIEYLRMIYHVEEDALANNFYMCIKNKKGRCEYHQLRYILKKENAKAIFNRFGEENVMVSLNLFAGKTASMKQLVSVGGFEISIDHQYHPLLATEKYNEVIRYLQENIFVEREFIDEQGKGTYGIDYSIEPSIYEVSNQIRLIYLIDRCRIPLYDNRKNRKIKRLIKIAKKKIENVLEHDGFKICYKENLNGFIHLPYSHKSKYIYNMRFSMEFDVRYYINSFEPYILQDILDCYKTKQNIEEARQRLTTNSENVKYEGRPRVHNIRLYNIQRLKDISKLFELRKNQIGCITNKEICFQYAVHLKLLGKKYSQIMNLIRWLFIRNREKITVPEIKEYIRGVIKNNYKFFPDDLARRFELTQEECKKYGLTSFVLSIGSKKNKKAYNHLYYISHVKNTDKVIKHLTAEEKNEIRKLYRQSEASVSELAEIYAVSETTIYKIVKDVVKRNKAIDDRVLMSALDLIEEGYTIKRIAEMFNVNYEALRKRIYRYRKDE